MTESEDQSELLFFDTFSHEVDTDVNLDLVQFPKPVHITQIRIIPLGARVEADFPGGVRLGATNPSKFDIDFFVNDLGIQAASTFEILGHMKYNQNDCIHLECEQDKITTDGLVLRGWYSTITLAVYGITRETINEPIASPPPLSMEPSEELCVSDETRRRIPADDDDEEGEWKEPLTADLRGAHKNSASDYERDDLEYADAEGSGSATRREHHYHHHSGDERRLRKTSRSSEHSRDSSRHRTVSENTEREYLRSREKSGRDWSRSPDYTSRRVRRRRSERSRSDVDEPIAKWPRTPPASIDSPLRPRSPDNIIVYDDDDVVCGDDDLSRSDLRFKLKSRSYLRHSRESLNEVASSTDVQTIDADVDEAPGTPIEQFEPILSDDELIGDDDDGLGDIEEIDTNAIALEEFEMEVQAAAASAEPAIVQFDPMKMPLNKYQEINWSSFYSKEVDSLQLLFKKFALQTKCNGLESFKAISTTIEERENFVFLSEQLINQLNFLAQHYRRRNIVLHAIFSSSSDKYLEMSFNILRIALDFEAANTQPQPAFKIRHIKVGARLMELLGSIKEFVDYMLKVQRFEPFNAVFELYHQDFMALSIKLMLLRAVYALLDTKTGLNYFVNSRLPGYRLILDTLQNTQLTRTKYALQAIIQKLNLHEALNCIHEQTTRLFVLTNLNPDPLQTYQLIEFALDQVLDAVTVNGLNYQQPRRFLPVSKKFEIVLDATAQRNFCNTLQAYFGQNFLAESLLLLISNGSDLPYALVVRTLDLLGALLKTNFGIDYLVDDCFEVTKLLVTILLGLDDIPKETEEISVNGDTKREEIDSTVNLLKKSVLEKLESEDNQSVVEITQTPKSPSISNETDNLSVTLETGSLSESSSKPLQDKKTCIGTDKGTLKTRIQKRNLNSMQKLGLEFAFKVETRYHLQAITHIASTNDYDSNTLAMHLHALYSQMCDELGREYTVELLTLNNNLQTLMDLIKKEQRLQAQLQVSNPSAKYKSPVLMYTVDIIDICVRFSSNINYLIEHGSELLDLAKNHENFEPSVSAVLQEMFVFLKPLEAINIFAYDDITPVVEVISRSLEYITTFPGDLIMGLRILRHLAINPTEAPNVCRNFRTEQLKYRFVALQFYTVDGINTLLQILEKLSNYFEQPGLHTPALASQQGLHCSQIILPTLQVLNEMLAYAIKCRDIDFKDLTAIDPLMKTYILLHYFPADSGGSVEAEKAKNEIINILLAYTQPHEQDELLLHKSLWTQMIREVLKNIDSPHTFIPGLEVFSKLLPMPLPMLLPRGCVEIENQQIQRLITDRKLWSAHLHPQSIQIVKLIESIAPTSNSDLLNNLLKLCVQLADLAPNMTLLISKTFTDLIYSEWTSGCHQKQPSNLLARLLVIFSKLTDYPSLKSSALVILSGKVWELFQSILKMEDISALTAQCQLSILVSLRNFLDVNISLVSPQSTSTPELNLASAIPPKEIIPRIVDALFACIFNAKHDQKVAILATQNLAMLNEHDITFYHVLSLLKQRTNGFQHWLQKTIEFDENLHCDECIRSLTALLRSFVVIEDNKSLTIPRRTLRLTSIDLIKLLIRDINVLERLDSIFKKYSIFDGELHDFVINLKSQANTCDSNSLAETDSASRITAILGNEPQLPQAESIVMQYAKRPIFINVERPLDSVLLTDNYWFKPLDADIFSSGYFEKHSCERVACDLAELASSCLHAEADLSAECKRVLHLSASPQSNRERTPTACFRTRRVEVEPSTGRPEKKPYITPGRGRGFVRPANSRGDLFRSRPPNTSRPPSLHVDDFLALETCGAQPTGPTGYNKIPTILRGSRGVRMPRGRIGMNSVYRKPKLIRNGSPSIWNDGSPQGHYRTPPNGGDGSHFGNSPGNEMHYSPNSHFSSRARGIRGMRCPRPYMR